jgi:hypothetical protein
LQYKTIPGKSARTYLKAGCWWLTSIILATQEAQIRRTVVQNQSGQIVCKTLSQKKKSQKGAGGAVQAPLWQKKKNLSEK